jgi:small-conductance mechanosensitive channel
MGKWKFIAFIVVSAAFAWVTRNSWNGILLFMAICLINVVNGLIREEYI